MSDTNILGTLTCTCWNGHFPCWKPGFTCWKHHLSCWTSDTSILGTWNTLLRSCCDSIWSSDKLSYYHNITILYNQHIFSVNNVKYQQKKYIQQIFTSLYASSILLTPNILCLFQNSFHGWVATTPSPVLSPFSAQQEVTRSCKVASSCNQEFYTQNITYTFAVYMWPVLDVMDYMQPTIITTPIEM